MTTRRKPRLNAVETVKLSELKRHPRNYREHPDDQLEHIEQSLRENGLYRNVVIARDGTILAGHGVCQAAERMGLAEIRVVRLPIKPDSPAALRVLAGDNEIGRRAEIDDRALSEILRDIKEVDVDGLLGTGYDERMLANLLFVTRPASEIADFDAAAAWSGMPDFDSGPLKYSVVVSFESEAERSAFVDEHGVGLVRARDGARVWSGTYPARPRGDLKSLTATA